VELPALFANYQANCLGQRESDGWKASERRGWGEHQADLWKVQRSSALCKLPGKLLYQANCFTALFANYQANCFTRQIALARLYQMRWDIEKTYDEIKNKLNEKKAWASSPAAKAMQAIFICLAHNLMVLQEHRLRREEGVTNTSEIKRKAKRLSDSTKILTVKNQVMPVLQQDFQRLTQRSVKYIRWLRAFLFTEAPWPVVVAALRESYELS
jgi:hypothetical protein